MPNVKTSRGVLEISERAFQEVQATRQRPKHELPASWWFPATAENMSTWLKLAKKFGWNGG